MTSSGAMHILTGNVCMIHSRAVLCAAQGRVRAEDFNMRIKYTDKDHAEIKKLSLKWWEKKAEKNEDILEYAVLQYRLKDYEAAVSLLEPLAEKDMTASFYLYADCLYYHSTKEKDREKAIQIYKRFLHKTEDADDPVVIWQRAMCYAYGLGTEPDGKRAFEMFRYVSDTVPEAEYEIGCAYRDGTLGRERDRELAELYLCRAWKHYAEQAIFALYDLYGREWDCFPYQRELTEAYSYQIGKHMRAVHVNPSVLTYRSLAELYLQGFPGDKGEDDARFRRKAEQYIRKAEELEKRGE